jgi:hypothetical protein
MRAFGARLEAVDSSRVIKASVFAATDSEISMATNNRIFVSAVTSAER